MQVSTSGGPRLRRRDETGCIPDYRRHPEDIRFANDLTRPRPAQLHRKVLVFYSS